MRRFQLEFCNYGFPEAQKQRLDVPDPATALLVADINLDRGFADLLDGERCLARIEKKGEPGRTYWHVQQMRSPARDEGA